jgi:TolB protein
MKHIFSVLLFIFSVSIHAADPIYITKGNAKAIPISINHFKFGNSMEESAANQVVQIIQQDLDHSGIFRSTNQDAFIENVRGFNISPNFSSWKTINTNFLVNGSVEKRGSKLAIKIALWDIYNEKNILSTEYEAPYSGMRKLAHKISDQIFENITGEKGYFDTQIAYTEESGNAKKRVKRIAIMDYDGANHRYITDGKKMAITPRLSPKGDKILYVSYHVHPPKVVLQDLKTSKKIIVGHYQCMSSAPRFAPKQNKMLMSIMTRDSANIEEINLDNKTRKRLTNDNSINSSPSYSPDEKQIVFHSDRSGSGQLYLIDSNGGEARRISFGAGNYSAPVWSPRGDYIAFIRRSADLGFSIGVMKPDGSGERILANGYMVDNPTWSPSGRYILFERGYKARANEVEKSRIYSIDISGNYEKRIHTPLDAVSPEWSQLLD